MGRKGLNQSLCGGARYPMPDEHGESLSKAQEQPQPSLGSSDVRDYLILDPMS